MKSNIYKFISTAKHGFAVLALAVLSGTAYSQNTYTFNYTGGQQTIALQPGTYTLETWGAEGGTNLGNGAGTYTQNGGKGGYSVGIYTLASTTTVYVNVGGRGSNSTSSLNITVPGGYNGGGYGSANSTAGKSSGAGGGGASHVATASGTLGALVTNQTSVRIVAGGGGGPGESNYPDNSTQYNSNGGNGGGLAGLQNITSGYQGRHGQGGTQLAGGGGGDNGSAIAGVPLQGIFGAGGYNPTAGVNTSIGGSGAGGGGGGWYGGGCGWVATGTSFQAGAGGGGSGYIGGVINGTTAAFGQTGYVANPDVSGNGYVLIKELCSITIFVAGTTNTANPAICSGQQLTLTTNAVSNFSWSTGQTTNSIVVAPTSNTLYTFSGTSSLSCNTSSTKSVTVNGTTPVLSIANPSNNLCLGQTATLTASGALSYTWANAGVVNGQTFTPAATAVYTVTGENGCGTTTATTTISVSPLAVTASSSASLVCEGTTATLTAGSAVNGYTWQPGAMSGSTTVVAPMATTLYTVTASDGICSGTQTLLVTTKTTPTIVASTTSLSICPGDQVVLSATGGTSYVWTPGNLTGSSVTVSPATSTLYVVVGTNSVNCTSSASQPVVVGTAAIVNVTANKLTTCSGGSVALAASGANTYVWTGGPSTAGYTVTPTSTTIYTVVGTQNNNPCTNTKTISIAVVIPNVTVSSNTAICNGGTVQLQASGATSYVWNGIPGGTLTVNPIATTLYTCVAQTNSLSTLCASTHTVLVTVNSNPTVTATGVRNTICKGNTNTLTATGAVSYVWQGTLGATASVTVSPTSTTIYTFVGTSAEGCTGAGQVTTFVSSCNSIGEVSAKTVISVYPNPNNGQFFVSSEAAITLQVINTLGQVVRVIDLNAENGLSIEVSGLAKGVYYLGSGSASDQNNYAKLIVN